MPSWRKASTCWIPFNSIQNDPCKVFQVSFLENYFVTAKFVLRCILCSRNFFVAVADNFWVNTSWHFTWIVLYKWIKEVKYEHCCWIFRTCGSHQKSVRRLRRFVCYFVTLLSTVYSLPPGHRAWYLICCEASRHFPFRSSSSYRLGSTA